MSRAFVKEPEGDQADEDLPHRPPSPHPNYVTPRGFQQLQARLQGLIEEREQLARDTGDLATKTRRKQIERDLRYVEGCLHTAIVVDAKQQSRNDIRFGAVVEVLDPDNKTHEFIIVGEDEACAPKGLISWVSPLARALLGKQAGDAIVWERPAGNVELEIVSFRYSGD